MQIKNRAGEIIYTDDAATMRETVEAAVKARANLAGANLAGAYLAGAYLAGANLAGADLARAYLAGADLAGANLADADLARANLADADLARANLARANLARANLADAKNVPDVSAAVLAVATPQKEGAPPRRSKDPAERLARYRELHPEVPVVEDLDRKILSAIEGGGGLEMSCWHTCETTHCMAGWAIHLAGERGKALEAERGPQMAGAMIFRASTGKAPHFFASNERALADLRKRVAATAQGASDAVTPGTPSAPLAPSPQG